MNEKLLEQGEKYEKSRKHWKRWQKLVGALACIVVFCTTYALILPAITMERTAYCGYEEHTHGEECYTKELICGYPENPAAQPTVDHQHTDTCYTEEKELICGKEESEGHTHTDECKHTEQVLICNVPESEGHTHSDSCYNEAGELICGKEESEGHIHTDSCYETKITYVCGKEESESHIHTDACYETKKVLTCGQEETSGQTSSNTHVHTDACYKKVLTCDQEEHTHTLICYSNPNADVETAEIWERTIPTELSGIWADDVLAVAKSQLGYRESTDNYIVEEDGTTMKGYTRYGAWYGDSYGDWCAMFISFCLNYAEVPRNEVPIDCNCQNWIQTLSDWGMYFDASSDYQPEPGDLIFFSIKKNGTSDHVGLVAEVNEYTIKTIEGNSGNQVEYNTYDINDARIIGYGELPENPEIIKNDSTESEEKSGTEEKTVKEEDVLASNDNIAMVYALDDSEADIDTQSLTQIPSDTGVDFGQYITQATVQKIVNGQWAESTEFKDGDQVRVTLNYSLPSGILSKDNRTIHYQLPTGVLPNESLSGRVYWQGQDVGDYYIDESGMIVIVFDESFAEDGEAVEGDIYFEGTVSSDATGTDKEIQFGGDGGTITIKKEEEEQATGDIKVEKETKSISDDKQTIIYEVVVSTTNGTGQTVKFEDWLTNGTFNQNSIQIQKQDADGSTTINVSDYNPTIVSESSGQQHLTIDNLPELKAGEKYVITYTVAVGNASSDGKLYVTNSASANGTSDWNETKVSETVISKSGYYNEDTEKIVWIIKINSNGADLNGYTVSDVMNDGELSGITAKLKNDDTGEESDIRLPYTFGENSKASYTITYETEVSNTSDNKVSNTASLTNGDQNYSSGTDVWISKRDWNLSKTKIREETDTNGNQRYTWQSNITLPNQSISLLEQFTYTDTILDAEGVQNESVHYGTVSELRQMIQDTITVQYVNDGTVGKVTQKENTDLFNSFFTYEIKFYDSNGTEVTEDNAIVTKFEVIFTPNTNDKVGKAIWFNYTTTGVTTDVPEGNTVTFKNKGEIPNHQSEAEGTYNNPLRLQKTSSGQGYLEAPNGYVNGDSIWNSFAENATVKVEDGDKIYYRLLLKPENNEYDIVLTDTLPEGVKYVDGSGYALYWNGNNTSTWGLWTSEGGHDLAAQENKPVFAQDGQILSITLPKGFSMNYPIAIFYAVSIDETAISAGESEGFINYVVWDKRHASTTTTVIKEKEVVSKTGKQLSTTDENGKTVWLDSVEYNVVINPTKEDLDVNSDTLTLYDTLNYSNLDGVYLDLANVKLYTYDPTNAENNYRGEVIDSSRYQVAYDNSQTQKQVLTVKLPDELACVLSYQYSYDKGSAVVSNIQFTNEVNLVGKSSKVDNLELKDNTSGAHVSKTQIKIYKVDSEDYSKLLPNAEFQLSSYHTQGEEGFEDAPGWKDHTPYLVTNQNGEFVLEADSSATAGEILRSDILYKLTETKAPDGYSLPDGNKPYYFIWLKDQTLDSYWWNILNDSARTEIGEISNIQILGESGGNIYIPNEYTSVGVKKVWLNQDGVAIDPGADEIQVQLMQTTKIADGYHVTIKFGQRTWDNSIDVKFTKEIVVKKDEGFTITVPHMWQQGQENQWSVTKDGNIYGTVSIASNGYPVITVNPIETDSSTIIVSSSWIDASEGVIIDTPEPDYTSSMETYGDLITLNQGNNWMHIWEELPRANDEGNSLYYTVKEITSVNGYMTSYTNNSGIQNGEIVITNTKEENKEEFVLPETGGHGTLRYIMGGILLMLASVLLYIRKFLKEGRRKHI